MEITVHTIRKWLLLIASGAALLLFIQNFPACVKHIGTLLHMLQPFLIGACIAFIWNVLMRTVEQRFLTPLCSRGSPTLQRMRRPIGILLSLAMILLVLFALLYIILPQIGKSFSLFKENLPVYESFIQTWVRKIFELLHLPDGADTPIPWESIWSSISEFLKKNSSKMLSTAMGTTISAVTALAHFILGFVFSVYLLLQKEKLGGQLKRAAYAYLPEKSASHLMRIAALANQMFARFITGQCTEAIIIGVLCFIGMVFLRLPYAAMISVLIGCTSVIPLFGAVLGTTVGTFLILMVNPVKALWFVIFIVILQQLESNLIYPHVVGSTIGLPGIWVFSAVALGGSLCGITGMLVSVPLCSILYCLVRESVNNRLKKKKLAAK